MAYRTYKNYNGEANLNMKKFHYEILKITDKITKIQKQKESSLFPTEEKLLLLLLLFCNSKRFLIF